MFWQRRVLRLPCGATCTVDNPKRSRVTLEEGARQDLTGHELGFSIVSSRFHACFINRRLLFHSFYLSVFDEASIWLISVLRYPRLTCMVRSILDTCEVEAQKKTRVLTFHFLSPPPTTALPQAYPLRPSVSSVSATALANRR